MNPQISKRHHYVPVSYLRRFCGSDGMLWRFDRVRQTCKRAAPKSIMYIDNYDRQDHAPPGVDPNCLETGLGVNLEQRYVVPLERLINAPRTLAREDFDLLVAYLEIQRIRVPRQFEEAKEKWRAEALRKASPRILDGIQRGVATLNFAPFARFHFMDDVVGQISLRLYQMRWHIVAAATGSAFVTTDSPVTYLNPGVKLPREPDLGHAGTAILFPLSSRHILVLNYNPAFANGLGPTDAVPELPVGTALPVRIRVGETVGAAEVARLNGELAARSERYVVAGSKHDLDACLARAPLPPVVRPLEKLLTSRRISRPGWENGRRTPQTATTN